MRPRPQHPRAGPPQCQPPDSTPPPEALYWRPAACRRGVSMAAETHGLQISRRQFVQGASVAGLGLLAGCGPWPGQARPRVPSVGWLSTYPRPTWYDAFRQGLREAGLIEGENLILHTRAADGQALQLQALATELVGLPVDVLVIPTSDDVATARRADHAV